MNIEIEDIVNDLIQCCPDLAVNCCGASSCVSCIARFLHTAGYCKSVNVATKVRAKAIDEFERVVLLEYSDGLDEGQIYIGGLRENIKQIAKELKGE